VEAAARLQQLADQRSSQSAEQLWRDAQARNIETEYREILARLEQLTRAFATSSIVSQNSDRIALLRSQCRARIYAADADESLATNNVFKALASYRKAAELDPALVAAFSSNFADALLFGVSNALSASDYDSALNYAQQFQSLHVGIDRLPVAQLDRIRLELAKLSYDDGDYVSAIRYISEIDERLMDEPRAALMAGMIYRAAGDPGRAGMYLENLVTQGVFLSEVRPLLLATAAEAADQSAQKLYDLIAEDPEWRQIVATFSISIPNAGGGAPATSTWQHLCVSLCDDVEMTYELLTYSGSEADLFLEKQRARRELDAALRLLQKTLRESIERRRDALLELRDINHWWALALDLATNTPQAELSEDMREHLDELEQKQHYADLALRACEASLMSDIQTKTQLLDYLKSLVTRMEAKLPLRNVLNGVKKFLSDETTPKRSRQALSAIAEMHDVDVQSEELLKDFSVR
jgi:tetratricopeptide (TPR) repeat protein